MRSRRRVVVCWRAALAGAREVTGPGTCVRAPQVAHAVQRGAARARVARAVVGHQLCVGSRAGAAEEGVVGERRDLV